MKKVMRSFRIPADLVERFDRAAEIRGVDKSEVVVKAIEKFVQEVETGMLFDPDKIVVVNELYAPELGKCIVYNSELRNLDGEPITRKWCTLKPLNRERTAEINGKQVRYDIEDARAYFDFPAKKCTVEYRTVWIGGEVEKKTLEFPIRWTETKAVGTPFIYLSVTQA